MQRFVDSVLGVIKESIKAVSQESFNNTIKLINGVSALILTFLPGKTTILEGVQGWELRPTLKAPRLPRWMEEGVSSFNQFIHEYAADSDGASESEYESGLDEDDVPSSPSSQTSQFSKASSFRFEKGESSRSKASVFVRSISDFLKYSLGITMSRPTTRPVSAIRSHSGSSGSLYRMYGLASRGLTTVKSYVVHHTTDRRHGIIEDMQLVVELFIERMFELVQRVLLYSFSPLQTLKLLARKFHRRRNDRDNMMSVPTATLGDSGSAPKIKKVKMSAAMNTDARTCQDVITELGYPYESFAVVTEDGYVITMERIPRRDAQKVLYLQHGILDSSLGWVSNGVVGSQAFAAYDQGYDVFLGNFRGLASREHVDRSISSQRYWCYSVNEHGTKDIPAMINKIHSIKMEELRSRSIIPNEIVDISPQQPYTLCGVAHSLGGAGLLMYVVTQRLQKKPHRLSRLILLSPAGFHKEAPVLCTVAQYLVPLMAPLLMPLIPGFYIRTRIFRGLFNKLARDFQNYPALGGLVQTLCSYVVGGDSSNWVGALGQTHYNVYDMPGVSYRVMMHLAQMRRADKFQMYDFGSVSANIKAYGSPYPLDIGANYGLIDIPVDLVAGKKDKLIPRSMVKRHFQTLKENGCAVSYCEFEYAHLDFTFSHREELLAYVMSKLLLVTTPKSARSRSRRIESISRRSRSSKIDDTFVEDSISRTSDGLKIATHPGNGKS